MDMAFSEDQKATIREIAWEVGKAICSEIRTDRAKDISLHVAQCDTARRVLMHEARAKGFVTAIVLVASTFGAALALIGKWFIAAMLGVKP